MGAPHQPNRSHWVETTPETTYPHLTGTVETDVAIVGGGITGLTLATLLKRAGLRVAVLEANRIALGTTGYTTAKVTSQHGSVYRDLIEQVGEEQAKLYAEANEAGLAQVAALVESLAINCEFQRAPAHIYTEDPGRVAEIEAEVTACQRLGLPASFTTVTDLPYPVQGAIRFERQARVHPRAYCLALAATIPGDGSHIFERTRALDVKEGANWHEVITGSGVARARHVVLATLLPFLDRGAFFTRTYPSRSYVLAARLRGPAPAGMYLSLEEPVRSVRPQEAAGGTLVLLGGEGHKVGHDDDTRQRYDTLEAWARERFDVEEITSRWSAQDYMPVDNLPYIGRLSFTSERLYVATGYRKWGMTTATVAAMIIADAIQERPNPWADLFDATRLNVMQSARQFVSANVDVARELMGGRLGLLRSPGVTTLAPGEGGIVEMDGVDVAAYRDDAGKLHAVSPACTHLGCILSWNTAERSWDCPCHGSRFGYDGAVLQGPAVRALGRQGVPHGAGMEEWPETE